MAGAWQQTKGRVAGDPATAQPCGAIQGGQQPGQAPTSCRMKPSDDQRDRQREHALARCHGGAVDAARLADRLLVLRALQALVRVALAGIAGAQVAHGADALQLLLHLELARFIEEGEPPLAQQQGEAREVEGKPEDVSHCWVIARGQTPCPYRCCQ